MEGVWKLSRKLLNEFFENWNQQTKNVFRFVCYFDDGYEDIIEKYQELVIRKFENLWEEAIFI